MPTDRSFQHENQIEREQLRAAVSRLTDDELRRPLPDGWTVAAALAHIAFWDQRALLLIHRFEAGGGLAESPADVDIVNDAVKMLCLALEPRVAARLVIETAEAVDRKLEALSDELLDAIEAAGRPIRVRRHPHRREHLDEIERLLGQ